MPINANVWSQLKGLTADELIKALQKDGWTQEERRQATIGFIKEFNHPIPSRDPKTGVARNFTLVRKRVVIHYHPKKQYGSNLLKDLIRDIGWTQADLRRLKLIK